MQAGTFQFAPANAGQIAGDQRQDNSPPLKVLEHGFYARAEFVAKVRDAFLVDVLGGFDQGRHSALDGGIIETTFAHHQREDVGVEHAVYGNAVGGEVKAGYYPHGFNERQTVMGTGAADQSAVDVEKDEGQLLQ